MLPEHVKVISLPPEVMGGITSAEGLVSPPTVETVDVFAMCLHLVLCVCVCQQEIKKMGIRFDELGERDIVVCVCASACAYSD